MNPPFPKPSSFEQQVQWGIEQGAFNDELGESLLQCIQHGVVDDTVRELVDEQLRPHVKEYLNAPPFRRPRLAQGNLILGNAWRDGVVRLPSQMLTEHMGLFANTGAGKTALLFHLLPQIAATGSKLFLSESYKKHLRRLRRMLRAIGHDLIILRPADWRWNPLQSPLDDPRRHLASTVDLLVRRLELPPRAKSILTQGCHELYRHFGIWNGNRSAYPTIFDLYEWILSAKGLNAAAREAILDRLGSLLVSLTPRCAAWRIAWAPADLMNHHLDIEFIGTSETVRQLMLESTLFSIFQKQIEQGVTNGRLKLFIACDDSQRMFEAAPGGEITPLDEAAGVVRGAGIGLCAIVQTCYGFSRRLLPNLSSKLIGRLGSGSDYSSLGTDLGLTTEQLEWAKLHLKPGTFIGQLSSGEWREPFVFTVPLVALPEAVSDEEACESVRPLLSLPSVPAAEFARWEPHHVAVIAEKDSGSPLSEVELRYLKAIIKQPGQSCSVYAKRAGLNGQRAAEVRSKLVEQGYAREHALETGGRGRHAIVLEPLEPAYAAAQGGDTP